MVSVLVAPELSKAVVASILQKPNSNVKSITGQDIDSAIEIMLSQG